MKFQFSPLILPEHPQFQPNNLMELARNLGSSGSFTSLEKLKNFPISLSRNIDEILTAIKHGQANQVSQLEWVYLIQSKAQWDTQHPDSSIATSKAIWEVATYNSWLSRLLLWRLVLYHSTQGETLAPTLAECFPTFVSLTKNPKPLPIQIVELMILGQSGAEVARIAREYLLTPKELLKRAELPVWIPIVEKALDYVARQFAKLHSPNTQQVDWLLRCLDEMIIQQQVSAVNDLLTQIPTKVGGSFPKLVDWLQRYYSPRGTGERWHRLTEQAKRALREWIGAINYGDFASLVNRLLEVLHNIENFEKNQLESRRKFWARYSNRFERIRILLPQTSVNALDRRVFTADIETLTIDGSTPTEVCIFDFGEWFVVEFFRGAGSETRLFPRNAYIEQVLFGSSRLCVKKLRRLGGEVHDHKFLWQFFCEKWLQDKGIYPNPGLNPWRIPEDDKLRDRERQLLRWQQDIEKLERQATEFQG